MATRKANRQLSAAGSIRSESIEQELSRLERLSLEQLRHAWRDRLGSAPPPLRTRDVLLRMLAWRIQAEAFGGFDSETERRLKEIAKGFERDPAYRPKTIRPLSPGVVLTREWKGVLQRVTITQDGFTHLGRHYASLSDVARAITGTRWSGPRFFGLEQKERPAVVRKSSS
jgi:hypothetical protein